jgi:hypothetical protein
MSHAFRSLITREADQIHHLFDRIRPTGSLLALLATPSANTHLVTRPAGFQPRFFAQIAKLLRLSKGGLYALTWMLES